MPNLIVSIFLIPHPVVTLMGSTLREATIDKLDKSLWQMSTNVSAPRRDPPKFEFRAEPDHWKMVLPAQFCDPLGQCTMSLSLIEALETEDWKLKASCACLHADSGGSVTKFFFHREA